MVCARGGSLCRIGRSVPCGSSGVGTGHIVYPLLPVTYETAHQSGIRPERPMAVATIASQQAITASPVSAATAATIGLFFEKNLAQRDLPEILMVCVPATLTSVLVTAIVPMFVGKDLKDASWPR
jgi:anaerobic C4-dicarboxylate transporter DcuA